MKAKELITFEEAVTFCKTMLSIPGKSFEPGSTERALTSLKAARRLGSDAEVLFEKASSDRLLFDAIRDALALKVLGTQPLNEKERVWVYRFLKDEIEPPPRASYRQNEMSKKVHLALLVNSLVQKGMKATRNDATEAKVSACDAVAVALKEMGLKPQSYRRVKNIWLEIDRYRVAENQFRIPFKTALDD